MSIYKPIYLLCDHDGCQAYLQAPDGQNGHWLRRHSIYRHAASSMVREAIRRGEMQKRLDCEECGSTNSVHAHHDDYAKPLEVRWLCQTCHSAWHRDHGPGKNSYVEDAQQ